MNTLLHNAMFIVCFIVAAASSVVAASAAGASTAATAAVAATGLVTQVGAAIIAGAVVAAVYTPGVTVDSSLQMDDFVPPVCSNASTAKWNGFAEFNLKALMTPILPQDKRNMEVLFRDVYNNISGMCLDPFRRILLNATLLDWETLTVEEGQQNVTKTVWSGLVSCSGCPGKFCVH